MDTQTAPRNVSVSFDVRPFPPYRSWMPVAHGALRRSLDWLHEEIRLDVMRSQKDWPKLELEEQIALVPEFAGVRRLMWRHRSCGVVFEGSLLVEYQLCEIGKPEEIVFKNTLTFKRGK